jgi:hypothetical protein
MKLKSLSNVTLKRKGYIEIKDIILPIATRGISEIRKIMRDLKYLYKLPMKIAPANDTEKAALKAFGYNVSSISTMVNRVDEGSEEYKDYINKEDQVSLFLSIAVQIDMLHPIGGDNTMWEHLGLKGEDDVLGLAQWLSSIGMDESDRKATVDKIVLIKDSNSKTYDDWIKIIKGGEEEVEVNESRNFA